MHLLYFRCPAPLQRRFYERRGLQAWAGVTGDTSLEGSGACSHPRDLPRQADLQEMCPPPPPPQYDQRERVPLFMTSNCFLGESPTPTPKEQCLSVDGTKTTICPVPVSLTPSLSLTLSGPRLLRRVCVFLMFSAALRPHRFCCHARPVPQVSRS